MLERLALISTAFIISVLEVFEQAEHKELVSTTDIRKHMQRSPKLSKAFNKRKKEDYEVSSMMADTVSPSAAFKALLSRHLLAS